MKQESQGIYTFHFVIGRDMKAELKDLDMYKKAGSLSGLIVNIFTLLAPGLENEYFYGKQRESCYEYVTDDPLMKREHIHVYMPDYLYRQLKLIHQDLNFYSIAQLARFFLRLFLDLVKEHGDGYRKEILKLLKQWEKKIKKNQFSHESLSQLLQFVHKNAIIIRLISIYTPIYTTIKKYRL